MTAPTSDEILADRVRRALNRPNAFVEEVGGRYMLRLGADRRRRSMLEFDEPIFRNLLASPGLKAREGGGWCATRPWIERPESKAGQPGRVEGEIKVFVDGSAAPRRANLASSAITWLARRKDARGRPWLARVQLAAAERLAEDHRLCGSLGRTTMDWSFAPRTGDPGGRASPAEQNMAAKLRRRRALEAVDSRSRPVLEGLCLRELTMGEVERELGLAARAARPLLQRALDQLASHYGLG